MGRDIVRKQAPIVLLALVMTAVPVGAQQGQPPTTPEQRVAMLQAWLKASGAQMRQYQWIEATTVSVDGEQKSHIENTCYFGVEGSLQKVPVVTGGQADSGGLPGILPPGKLLNKLAEKKAAEMQDYLKQVQALVGNYVPPSAERIQAARDAGKMTVNVLKPGKTVRLDFHDYLKSGDVLGVQLEVPTNRLMAISVASYVDEPSKPVSAEIEMGVLPDGTVYTYRTTLDAPDHKLSVVTENTGYRKLGG